MEEQKTSFGAGIIASATTSILTFLCINAVFSMNTNDWIDALYAPEWFAWVLAIAVFLVPLITGLVCGSKGCSALMCFSLTIAMEMGALVVSFIIGFVAAILSLIFEDIIGITIIASLFIAFTATPVVVIAIIE